MIILLNLIVLPGQQNRCPWACADSWSSSFDLIGGVAGLHVDLYVVFSNR